jgi:hypothetical protein
MRTWPAICVLVCAFPAIPAAADETYVANILNHKGTRWTGVVSLGVPAGETVTGELCLVRAESEDSAAFPRTLLKVLLVGKRSRVGMDLRIPTVESGPLFKAGTAELQLLSEAASNLVPAGSWQFGDLGTEENKSRKFRPKTTDYARFMAFTRDPELLAGLTILSGTKLGEVSVYRTRKDAKSGNATAIDMAAYDSLTREQVRAFERSKIMADLYTDGMRDVGTWERVRLALSPPAFILGPLYLLYLGLWRPAISLTGASLVYSVICDAIGLPASFDRVAWVIPGAAFAYVCIPLYYLRVRRGIHSWNPFIWWGAGRG